MIAFHSLKLPKVCKKKEKTVLIASIGKKLLKMLMAWLPQVINYSPWACQIFPRNDSHNCIADAFMDMHQNMGHAC